MPPVTRSKRGHKHQDAVKRRFRAEYAGLTPSEKRAYRRELMDAALADAREEEEVNVFPYLPFYRLVKEIGTDFKAGLRFSKKAVDALHVDTEAYMTELMEQATMAAVHAGRKTVMLEDIEFVRASQPGKFDLLKRL
jgi:histone H3